MAEVDPSHPSLLTFAVTVLLLPSVSWSHTLNSSGEWICLRNHTGEIMAKCPEPYCKSGKASKTKGPLKLALTQKKFM